MTPPPERHSRHLRRPVVSRRSTRVPGRVRSVALVFTVAACIVAGCSNGNRADGSANREVTSSTAAAAVPDVDQVLAIDVDNVVATVDPRFQSYNVEMVEVTGGEFWKPYDSGPGKVVRSPIDLSSVRLRNLAKALGPAYIRVSGTWANSTYFDPDGTTGGAVPEGFNGVLTGDQWIGVGDFADAVDGEIVGSFASSDGVHGADGAWIDDQAREFIQFTLEHEIPLVAAEFYNEPGFNIGVPTGYDAAAFSRDFKIFTATVDELMPDLAIVGPGSGDDVTPIIVEPLIKSADVLELVGPGAFDTFSFHFYPKVSERCGSEEGPEAALSKEYLEGIEIDQAFYKTLRDQYAPSASMWMTETAQAACGGDRWASHYIDVIRYLDTLGRMADGDGDVVFHNTLVASDYGLIDEDNLQPRPNYWAAVVWQQVMGNKVVAVKDAPTVDDLAVYAHCTPDSSGVTYAVVNSSRTESRTVATGTKEVSVFQLTGQALDGDTIALNGETLAAADDGTIPEIKGASETGPITTPPASVTFVADPTEAKACA